MLVEASRRRDRAARLPDRRGRLGLRAGRAPTTSTFVPVGVAPRSGLAVEWKVKIWTDLGESEWSEPSLGARPARRVGLVRAVDRAGRADDGPALQRPAYQLAGAVTVDGAIAAARLYATAHGVYEASSTARASATIELTHRAGPRTARNLHVQTYDVTDLLVTRRQRARRDPQRRLVARAEQRARAASTTTAPTTAFLAQLVVTLTSGDDRHVRHRRRVAIDTEPHPRRRPHRRRGARLRRRADWPPGRLGSGADRRPRLTTALRASPAPPVRRVEALRPVSVTRARTRAGAIVDFGQNINGWIRLRGLGPAGTEITLTYGEWLDHDGDVTQEHVDVRRLDLARPRP